MYKRKELDCPKKNTIAFSTLFLLFKFIWFTRTVDIVAVDIVAVVVVDDAVVVDLVDIVVVDVEGVVESTVN